MPESSAIAGAPGRRRGGARLAERVLREGLARLRAAARRRRAAADDLVPGQQLGELAHLVRVAGREHEPHQAGGALGDRALLRGAQLGRCPAPASASSSSRCARESGVRSAVACTSTSAAVAGHDDVRVDLGASSPRGSRGRAAARRRRCRRRPRRPMPVSGRRSMRSSADEARAAERERDVAAGDRRAARAAVGLQHVAVDVDRALAERREVDDAAQRAADQALDLDACARRGGPWRCRAACGRRSTPGASRTRR